MKSGSRTNAIIQNDYRNSLCMGRLQPARGFGMARLLELKDESTAIVTAIVNGRTKTWKMPVSTAFKYMLTIYDLHEHVYKGKWDLVAQAMVETFPEHEEMLSKPDFCMALFEEVHYLIHKQGYTRQTPV